MDLIMQSNALKLVKSIMDRSVSTTPIIAANPQKTAVAGGGHSSQPLDRATPESQGIDSGYIGEYLNELLRCPKSRIHTLTIMRNGKIISQTSPFPYRSDVWHISHSYCKSVTGLAIGILVGEGKLSLDDKASKFFARSSMMLGMPRTRLITVRQLLTMSSGVVFNEVGTVTELDWVRSFFESGSRFESGTQFSYNSMNTYILSAIVKQISGQGLSEFLGERVLSKMGIADFYWEKCPMGIEKGGMGLYMRPEDMAKIGQLYLQKGNWNGEQLVPAEWCEQAVKAQISVPESLGDYDYGYQMWVRKERNWFVLNGMFGQNVLVFPDSGIIVAATAGNSDMFQKNAYFTLTEKYFGELMPDTPKHESFFATRKLRALESELASKPQPKMSFWRRSGLTEDTNELVAAYVGKSFALDRAEGMSVGLLPLMTQAIQNNYTKGVQMLSLSKKEDKLWVELFEEDESHSFPVGFERAEYVTLDFHGEKYEVGVSGDFVRNEDGIPVLKLLIAFLEIPNERIIKIYFDSDSEITVKWKENPGRECVIAGVKSIFASSADTKLLNSITGSLDSAFPAYLIKSVFEPEVSGRLYDGESDTEK
ncbi:MAG: serine hydrolase [Oscillospiraceae bacterium]